MMTNEQIPDLMTYHDLYNLLHEKFKATHDELRYWIKKSLEYIKILHANRFNFDDDENLCLEDKIKDSRFFLFPYSSDLPYMDMYEYPASKSFFYPECYFYDRQFVNKFIPYPILRFVYQKDLTAFRNWNDYVIDNSSSLVSQTLLKANEYGILRFYNKKIDDFTTHINDSQIWYQSFEGKDYAQTSESFFLLYEILNIERIFFNKDRKVCLEELGIKMDAPPSNVYQFTRHPLSTKDIK